MRWVTLVGISLLSGCSSAEQESAARLLEAAGVRGGLIVHASAFIDQREYAEGTAAVSALSDEVMASDMAVARGL